MQKLIALCLAIVSAASAQLSVGSVTQSGGCTVAGVLGNVTINCPGVPPTAIKTLANHINAQFHNVTTQLKALDGTDRLHGDFSRLLDDFGRIRQEADHWKDMYVDIRSRFAYAALNDGLKKQVEELLTAGKLDEAGPS